MKKLTKKQVMDALQRNQSLEHEEGKSFYYLHIREDGVIVNCYSKADESFRVEVNIPKSQEEDWYDHEIESNSAFMGAVEELTGLANNWLKDWGV